MARERIITQESFDSLLNWLDQDRESAAQRYEIIRARLIKIFVCQGCSDPEELADLTINRVIAKLPDIKDGFTGDPLSYFHGVARNIYLESLRKKEVSVDEFPPLAVDETDDDAEYDCLVMCLNLLPPHQRDLILGYYESEKQAKIDHRKELARKLGLTAVALRLQAHRTRTILKECVQRCVMSRG